MKKLLLLCCLIFSISSINAQTLTVLVDGHVTDANGNAVANANVDIFSDSTFIGWMYWNTVTTDANGYYIDTITGIPNSLTQGGIHSFINCGGSYSTQSGFYSPGSMSVNLNHTCGGSTGGSCTATFVSTTSAMSSNVSFVPTATGTAPFTYAWDFGDGAFGVAANPTHTYNSNGLYMACLVITDATGCVTIYCDSVVVSGATGGGCGGSFVASPSGMSLATWSFSPFLTGTAPFAYTWDFGDGNTSTSANPTHTYNSNGLYMACLTATDATGCVVTYCDSVGVFTGGGGCTASFVAIPSVNTPNTLTFTGFATGVAPFAYTWDFGDGNTSTSANPTHTYASTGLYVACLTATDANGCTSTYCDSVLVSNAGNCYSTFTSQPLLGSPLGVSFNVTATGTAPFTYSWDFGDSTTGTGVTPAHVYTNYGYYLVCVTVTDATGCVSVTCQPVVVVDPNAPCYTNVVGAVTKDTIFMNLGDAMVWLIELDTVAGTLTAVDSMMTVQGHYWFDSIPCGNYLVKAALNATDPDYGNYLPTYHWQSLYWSNAASTMSNAFMTYDIYMIQGTSVGSGPGFVGGLIVQGANFGPGDPLANVTVLLFDANMNPVTHTLSDANGNYGFSGLPYGTYYVYVEYLGVTAYHHMVVIDGTTPSYTLDFEVGTVEVLSATRDIAIVEGIQVFPNPTTDIVNLSLDLKEATDLTVTLMNLNGQAVLEETGKFMSGKNLMTLNVEQLPAGIYMLNIHSGKGVISHKLVKQF